MQWTRVTLALNDMPPIENGIPIHGKYHSTRLTVYIFGSLTKELEEKLLDLIDKFTEGVLGYTKDRDWWWSETYHKEETRVNPKEAKGLGAYYAVIAFEDENGNTIETEKVDIHKRRFGAYI